MDAINTLNRKEFHIPTPEELDILTAPELGEIFAGNHANLRQEVEKIGPENIPYIGGHGTAGDNVDKLLQAEHVKKLDVATIHEKPDNPDALLATMYDIFGGIQYYIIGKHDKAGLVVFKTSDKNGEQGCYEYGKERFGWGDWCGKSLIEGLSPSPEIAARSDLLFLSKYFYNNRGNNGFQRDTRATDAQRSFIYNMSKEDILGKTLLAMREEDLKIYLSVEETFKKKMDAQRARIANGIFLQNIIHQTLNAIAHKNRTQTTNPEITNLNEVTRTNIKDITEDTIGE